MLGPKTYRQRREALIGVGVFGIEDLRTACVIFVLILPCWGFTIGFDSIKKYSSLFSSIPDILPSFWDYLHSRISIDEVGVGLLIQRVGCKSGLRWLRRRKWQNSTRIITILQLPPLLDRWNHLWRDGWTRRERRGWWKHTSEDGFNRTKPG